MTSPVSAVEAIEKAMEGVTPGTWVAGYSTPGARTRYVYADNAPILETVDRDGRQQSRANAAYIANCNPVAMREVLALARKAEASQRENAELRESLSEILETAEQYWANPGEISEIVRARTLIQGDKP